MGTHGSKWHVCALLVSYINSLVYIPWYYVYIFGIFLRALKKLGVYRVTHQLSISLLHLHILLTPTDEGDFFVPSDLSLTLPVMSSRECFIVNITDDQVIESDEYFSLYLSVMDPFAEVVEPGENVTIIDNEGMLLHEVLVSFT